MVFPDICLDPHLFDNEIHRRSDNVYIGAHNVSYRYDWYHLGTWGTRSAARIRHDHHTNNNELFSVLGAGFILEVEEVSLKNEKCIFFVVA
jgi:hypothetical protein